MTSYPSFVTFVAMPFRSPAPLAPASGSRALRTSPKDASRPCGSCQRSSKGAGPKSGSDNKLLHFCTSAPWYELHPPLTSYAPTSPRLPLTMPAGMVWEVPHTGSTASGFAIPVSILNPGLPGCWACGCQGDVIRRLLRFGACGEAIREMGRANQEGNCGWRAGQRSTGAGTGALRSPRWTLEWLTGHVPRGAEKKSVAKSQRTPTQLRCDDMHTRRVLTCPTAINLPLQAHHTSSPSLGRTNRTEAEVAPPLASKSD